MFHVTAHQKKVMNGADGEKIADAGQVVDGDKGEKREPFAETTSVHGPEDQEILDSAITLGPKVLLCKKTFRLSRNTLLQYVVRA